MHKLRREVPGCWTHAVGWTISWSLDARFVSRTATTAHMCNCRTTVSEVRVAGVRQLDGRAPRARDFEAVLIFASNGCGDKTVKGSRMRRARR